MTNRDGVAHIVVENQDGYTPEEDADDLRDFFARDAEESIPFQRRTSRDLSGEQRITLVEKHAEALACLAPHDGIVLRHWTAMTPAERAAYAARKYTFGRRCA